MQDFGRVLRFQTLKIATGSFFIFLSLQTHAATDIPKSRIYKALSMTVVLTTPERIRADRLKCHGVLISPRKVLTAGHCLESIKKNNEELLIGVYKLSEGEIVAHYYEPQRSYIHPDYLAGSNEAIFNDVGIVELKQEVSFVFVDINRFMDPFSIRMNCFVVDWRMIFPNFKPELESLPVNEISFYSFREKDPDISFWEFQKQRLEDYRKLYLKKRNPNDYRDLLSVKDTIPAYSKPKIKNGQSGSPVWCYDQTKGLYFVGLTISIPIDEDDYFFSQEFNQDLSQWIKNSGT